MLLYTLDFGCHINGTKFAISILRKIEIKREFALPSLSVFQLVEFHARTSDFNRLFSLVYKVFFHEL